MSVGSALELLASALSEGGKPSPKTLRGLMEATGLSRVTVLKYVKSLRNQRLITEKTLIQGRGRPRLLFQPSKTFLRMTSAVKQEEEPILIRFEKLKTLCRHAKGSRCKKTLRSCRIDLCPFTIK